MGLRDFFSRIVNKIKGNEIKQLPPPQTAQESNFIPVVEKNAYVDAYTKSINVASSTFKINEDGTRLQFTDSKTGKDIDIQRITKVKEDLNIGETKIDLYKSVLAVKENDERKSKKVYFALPYGKNLIDLYTGSTKKASLKNKLKKMFSENVITSKKLFLGIIIEDEIYKDYTIAKSAQIEEYVIELDKKRQIVKTNKAKSKEQVKKTLNNVKGKNETISKAKQAIENGKKAKKVVTAISKSNKTKKSASKA